MRATSGNICVYRRRQGLPRIQKRATIADLLKIEERKISDIAI